MCARKFLESRVPEPYLEKTRLIAAYPVDGKEASDAPDQGGRQARRGTDAAGSGLKFLPETPPDSWPLTTDP